ncbi:methenyltetrahydromethanopterin cyclohydrolase [Candidatus Bathyarchaeota archaeon]|nr:MAG: methenyltetrahydromethanopterin cyclohydrolase [Candidatus Bathyarchaeota archaeon]
MNKISINKEAEKIVKQLIENPDFYNVKVEKLPCGATIIDTGLEVEGGYLAGLKVTEICLGGLGTVSLTYMKYGELDLPTIVVSTDHPSVSLLAAQFAGWNIKVGEYSAIGSGPARALSTKPKKLYEKIGYKDDADVAVLVLETEKKPGEEVALKLSGDCKVKPENLYMVLAPTASVAGSTQIAGRIVETGLFRLEQLGLDPLKVLHGTGYAPIMPVHPDSGEAMGRANDSLFYGGVTYYTIDIEDDSKLKEMVDKAPSSTAKDYGKPFYEIYKAAGYDFYKIDTALFAPASLTATSKKTGATFTAGKVNVDVLKRSIGLT